MSADDDVLYFDVETDRLLSDVGLSGATLSARSAAQEWSEYMHAASSLRVTVAVTRLNNRVTIYLAEGFSESQEADGIAFAAEAAGATLVVGVNALAAAMDVAPTLCAWNASFDIQVMSSYAPRDSQLRWCRSCCAKARDPMLELQMQTGRMQKLSTVASHTLGPGAAKLSDGVGAVQMFERGQWTNLARYCEQDVALLQRLAQSDTLVAEFRVDSSMRPLATTSMKRKYAAVRSTGTQTQTDLESETQHMHI
jgi:hypothetical protein